MKRLIMQKQIQKSIHDFMSKVKTLNKQMPFPACKHCRTASISVAEHRESDAATLADIDRFLFENFRSLYPDEENGEEDEEKTSVYLVDSTGMELPELEGLCASDRFFVEFGSSSPRIADEASSSSSSSANEFHSASEGDDKAELEDDVIVLLRKSRSPYEDFWQSMKAMVEAHLSRDGNVDWKYLEELLGYYLDLNNRSSHKYIVHAFADLVALLRQNLRHIPARFLPQNGRASLNHV